MPKYRTHLLVGEVAKAARVIFQQVAEAHDMEIDIMEVMEDYVHLSLFAGL